LSGRRGAAHVNRGPRVCLDQIGGLDHHDRIGAARDHAAGRNRGGRARRDFERRRVAAHDDFTIEP
jgi:hypothetical protein